MIHCLKYLDLKDGSSIVKSKSIELYDIIKNDVYTAKKVLTDIIDVSGSPTFKIVNFE